jgi:hypothetical protein
MESSMSIPVATTTITIKRVEALDPDSPDTEVDPWEYDPDAPAETETERQYVLDSNVRAVISTRPGRSGSPGDTETVVFELVCDPTDLTHKDVVVDEISEERYEVLWAQSTPGIAGLAHVRAGLVMVTGPGNE